MIQTHENRKKTHFEPDLGPLGPKPLIYFREFYLYQ